MTKHKILIVDDDASIRLVLSEYLKRWGYEPIETSMAAQGEKVARDQEFTAAILDYMLPDFDGIELFRRINRLKPGTPMILITGAHRPQLTIEAMSEGLYHYMPKPVDMDELRIHLDRAINMKNIQSSRESIGKAPIEDWFIGSSPPMVEVFRQIGLFANTNMPVLIIGETGTGKELVARALHKYSNRRDENFVTVHLSTLSPNLIESELFGHEKGAFTGADKRHMGRLEASGSGSLFIDELADIPIETQVKLLRVLEYGDFVSVGGEKQLKWEARLIVAANTDPKLLVEQNRLREDLFFRLDVCRISLPPLRERREDILELADYFIARENADKKRDIIGMSDDVISVWESYGWPGNVRQLQNTVRRAISLTRDSIISETFLDEIESGERVNRADNKKGLPNLKDEVGRVEKLIIKDALKITYGNLSHAAQLIGLTRRELQGRLEKYDIRKS